MSVMIACLIVAGGTQAGTPITEMATSPLPLAGWEYRWDPPEQLADGSLHWANEDLWQRTTPPEPLEGRAGRDRVWYRVRIPRGAWTTPTVFISGVSSAFEAFERHRSVYRWGRMSGEGSGRVVGWSWHLIPLSPEASGRYLYLHVHSTELHIGLHGATAIGYAHDHVIDIMLRDVPSVVVGVGALVLGLLATIIFVARREQRVFALFAAYAFSQALGLVSFSELKQLVLDAPTAWRLALGVGRMVGPPMLLAFVAQTMVARRLRNVIERAAFVVIGVGLALLAARVAWPGGFGLVVMHWANGVFLVSVVVALVCAAAGWRTGRRSARWLVAALVIFLAAAINDALVTLGQVRGPLLHVYGGVPLLSTMTGILLHQLVTLFQRLRDHATELEIRNAVLARMEVELNAAIRGRDDFLSIASHELRNPLATIAADAWLLARDGASPGSAARAEMIVRQTRHLSRLVDDMADAARVSNGLLTLRTEPVSLQSALDDVVAATRCAAAEKGLRVEVSTPEQRVWVQADPTRLDQILGNLLRNAIKYTPPGGSIFVRVRAEAHMVALTVSDTGVGLTGEAITRIFELYERGNVSSEEGMGVGLALVRRLVELHGGAATARSGGPGQGSEFEVTLPRSDGPEERTPAAAGSALAGPLPVLLIDDNANLRRSLRLALQLSGLSIAEAGDGERGLEQLLSGAFAAAVVDLRLPGMDGCEIARRTRASSAGAGLRLIALTGHAQAEERARAEAAGFDYVLIKPTDPSVIARLLRGDTQGVDRAVGT